MKHLWPLLLISAIATPLRALCRLCAPSAVEGPSAPAIPLTIQIDAALDLGRAAQTRPGGAGGISIDAQTGARRVTGTLADLGGFSLKGMVVLTGQPFAAVVVTLPNRITLTSPDGSQADVVDIRTDLSPAATLNAQGKLFFGFGGKLIVTNGTAGDFRGRIPVTADYR